MAEAVTTISGRCTECGRRFAAEARSGPRQRVCGAECRLRRRAKRERGRRRAELETSRADERVRQQRRRAKGVEKVHEGPPCHWPPEAHKDLETLEKVDEIVQDALRASLTALRPRLRRILQDFRGGRDQQGVASGG